MWRRLPAGARRPGPRLSPPPASGATSSPRRPRSRSRTSTRRRASRTSTRRPTSGCPGSTRSRAASRPTMYRSRFWTMRQYAGFATAAETNERFRYLLTQGQTGLSVAFDLPTQMGYDSDAPEAEGEVGRVGVPISSLADMETLLRGHPAGRGQHLDDDQLDRRRSSSRCTWPRRRSRGSPRSAVSGTTQNDILKEYIARGTWIYPPRAVDAPRDRRVRVRQPRAAQVEHDLDLGLPHARGRGDGGPGAGVHAGRRDRLRRGGGRPGPRRGRLRPAPVVLLRRLVASCSRRSPSSGRPAGCGPGS